MENNTMIVVRGGYNKDKKELKPWNKAIKRLTSENAQVAKRVIMDRCKWTEIYYDLKKNGRRGITDPEEEIVQSTLQALGVTWEPVAIEPAKK
jgi:hypothetical protein